MTDSGILRANVATVRFAEAPPSAIQINVSNPISRNLRDHHEDEHVNECRAYGNSKSTSSSGLDPINSTMGVAIPVTACPCLWLWLVCPYHFSYCCCICVRGSYRTLLPVASRSSTLRVGYPQTTVFDFPPPEQAGLRPTAAHANCQSQSWHGKAGIHRSTRLQVATLARESCRSNRLCHSD